MLHYKPTSLSRSKDPNDRIVFLSHVPLDNQDVVKAFFRVLDGFKLEPPNIFVLCGPFTNTQIAYECATRQRTAFQQFSMLLKQFLAQNSVFSNVQFVLVPSLEDFPSLIVLPA